MAEGTVYCNVAAITDVGMVRKNNEDNLIIADLVGGSSMLGPYHQIAHRLGENSILLVVSDGMGGAECGEVASELTVYAIKDALMKLPRNIPPYNRLVAAVEEANNLVWNEGRTNPSMKGMGATVTAALIEGEQVFIAEVGDSRAYLIRGGNIKQVTTDQSFVAQLISKGLLRPEDAVVHPRKNVILQSIGVQEIVQVAVSMFELKQGDMLLICSDGLSNLVHTGEMLFFSESLSPDQAAQKLVNVAKDRGGQDNITVILAKFEGDALQTSQQSKSLTGMLQTLSSFDPEQEAEKTHMRTQLLGNTSLSNKFYGQPGDSQAKLQILTNLAHFPNSAIVKQECDRLIEWLDYCRQALQIKQEQVEQAAQWLESQGAYFVNLTDTLEHIQGGMEDLDKAKARVLELIRVFDGGGK